MASLVLTAATLGGTTAITPTDQSGAITLTLPSTTGTLVTTSSGTITTARLAFSGTTLPSAGTATIFSRSSDNNFYLQTGSGNTTYLLDGSQNTMYTASPTAHYWGLSNSTAMTLTNYNLGIGATPINFTYQTIQFPAEVAFGCNLYQTSMAKNLYYAAGWKYIAASQAGAIFTIDAGQFNWTTTGSATGSAGGAASTTQVMTLNPSGGLLINTASASSGNTAAKFVVKGGSGTDISEFQVATNGVYAVDFRNSAGNQAGYITVNSGTVTYNSVSDYRLKNTIAPMTGALAKVIQLKPCTYKWNEDNSESEGFIAHELAEVCPHAVTGTKDAVDENGNPKYQGIDTSFLVATLTSAIQELSSLVTAQSATITSLTERITALEAK